MIAYVLETPPCMGNTVSVINTATNTALKPITVGLGVNAIAVTPNGKTVYVSSGARITNGTVCGSVGPQTGANTVTPISTATNMPGKPINAGESPGAIAITPDGKTAYVLSQRGVVPISTATNEPGKPVNAGKDLTGIAITPNGKTAYVVSTFSATVTPIRTATNTALKAIKIGKPPTGYEFPDQIAITPNSRTAYVSTTAGVVPIRTATNTALKPIKAGTAPRHRDHPGRQDRLRQPTAGVVPIRAATSTAGKLRSGTETSSAGPPRHRDHPGRQDRLRHHLPGPVTPISTATNTAGRPIVKSSPGSSSCIGIAPDGRTAYVLNGIFEPASFPGLFRSGPPPTPRQADHGGPLRGGRHHARQQDRLAPTGSDTVVPVSTATNVPGKAIKVGNGPRAIAITPNGRTAEVPNYGCIFTPHVDHHARPAIRVGSRPDAMRPDPGKSATVGLSSAIRADPGGARRIE